MNGLKSIDYRAKKMVYLLGMSLMLISGLMSVLTVSQTNGPVAQGVIGSTCSLYSTIHAVLFVVGLTLIIVGAALYAGSHILPGGLKGSAQGYGMGMIVGGVVGVILALAAPFILSTITGNSLAGNVCQAYLSSTF